MNNNKDSDIYKKISNYLLKITDEVQQEPVCLTIHNQKETIYGTLGNISTIIGKPKSRKTYLVSNIVGASLKNGYGVNFQASFPDNKRLILYIDTEQGAFHAQKVNQRIVKIANYSLDKHPDNLKYFKLRGLSGSQIVQVIEIALNFFSEVGLLVIDGIRDLVKSINDERESTFISTKLLKWSADHSIHIINILHQNKGNDDARGHLGTELVNKSESVIEIVKDNDISIIKPKNMRDQDFTSFAFGIGNDDIPFSDQTYEPGKKLLPGKEPTVKELEKDQIKEIGLETFKEGNQYTYSIYIQKLKPSIKKVVGFDFGMNKVNQVHKRLQDLHIIGQNDDKLWTLL